VASYLNALPSIVAAGGVTVAYGVNTANPSYTISFVNPGQEKPIVPNFALNVQLSQVGSATTPEIDVITLPTRGDLDPVQMSTANIGGSIADILRPNATAFSFTPLMPGPKFQFGDVPLDGLIAVITPTKPNQPFTFGKNFIPEAFVTADASGQAVLVDNVNS
jgi:hypothetical protein